MYLKRGSTTLFVTTANTCKEKNEAGGCGEIIYITKFNNVFIALKMHKMLDWNSDLLWFTKQLCYKCFGNIFILQKKK